MGGHHVQVITRTRELKTIKFPEGKLDGVLNGKDKITLRKYRVEAHLFEQGESIIGEFADHKCKLVLKITKRTEVVRAGDLPDAVAKEEGHADKLAFALTMRDWYPDFSADTEVAIIRFEKA